MGAVCSGLGRAEVARPVARSRCKPGAARLPDAPQPDQAELTPPHLFPLPFLISASTDQRTLPTQTGRSRSGSSRRPGGRAAPSAPSTASSASSSGATSRSRVRPLRSLPVPLLSVARRAAPAGFQTIHRTLWKLTARPSRFLARTRNYQTVSGASLRTRESKPRTWPRCASGSPMASRCTATRA